MTELQTHQDIPRLMTEVQVRDELEGLPTAKLQELASNIIGDTEHGDELKEILREIISVLVARVTTEDEAAYGRGELPLRLPPAPDPQPEMPSGTRIVFQGIAVPRLEDMQQDEERRKALRERLAQGVLIPLRQVRGRKIK